MPVSPKRLSTLVSALGVESRWLFCPDEVERGDPLIGEVTLDLNEVTEGTLFIARKLWYVDTHQHVADAIDRGAAAIIVSRDDLDSFCAQEVIKRRAIPIFWVEREDPTLGLISDRFYEQPSAELKVYGVTGTNGKTSAVTFLSELLGAVGERVAVIGTVEYRFEDRKLVAPNTTPDALVIQRFMREAIDLGATALALEVSSHALSLDRVAGLRFDAVGFTSFSRDHLDFHGSLEAYRDAKGRLFSDYLAFALREGKSPVAVSHRDEDGLLMLNRTPKGVRCIHCEVQGAEGYESGMDVGLLEDRSYDTLNLMLDGEPSLRGLSLSASFTGSSERSFPSISAPLIGDYHPFNVAIAFGIVAGTHPELDVAWESIAPSNGVIGRMEVIPPLKSSETTGSRLLTMHTPDAIKRALQAIRAVHRGEVSVVIGCGGDRDRGKRLQMLRAALDGQIKCG